MPPRVYQCTVCGARPETVEELMRCSSCLGTVRYCSRPCQKSDWSRHKVECMSTDPLIRVRSGGLKTILEFLDLPARVVLSSCSKPLQAYIFVAIKSIWIEIDFGKAPAKFASRISDESLRALLQRADACNVTKVLSLRGCTSLEGYGLDAIRGSSVLEEIDLRLLSRHIFLVGETGLNDAFVLKVLSSMPPMSGIPKGSTDARSRTMGLSVVKFRRQYIEPNYYASFHGGIDKWLIRFDIAKEKQIRTIGKECSHCNKTLADSPRFSSQCFCKSCEKHSCARQSCPLVGSCRMCAYAYCSGCKSVTSCDVCRVGGCEDCVEIDRCSVCDGAYCEGCRAVCFCGLCLKGFCDNLECDKPGCCNYCDTLICPDCDDIIYCNICEKYCCRECRGSSLTCQTCNLSSCGECGHVNTCVGCKGTFCQGCQSMGHCSTCDKWWCEKCEVAGTSCGGRKYYRCKTQRLSHADFIWRDAGRVYASKSKKSAIVQDVLYEWVYLMPASFRGEWCCNADAVTVAEVAGV